MSKYRLGITVSVKPDGDLGFFENGLKQNVWFLYELFRRSPNCEAAFLLNDSGHTPKVPDWMDLNPARIVPTLEAGKLDYVIGAGTDIALPIMRHLREHGTRCIAFKGGNSAVMSMEAIAGRPEPSPGAECYNDYQMWDAIWMTPQHENTYRSWCETLYRVPIHVVPQIWAPTFIDRTKIDGWGYEPGREKWRVASMDPNNTVMKTSHWPALIMERAYRFEPELWEAFYITNAVQFKDYLPFKTFMLALSASSAETGHGKMTVEQRFLTSQFLAHAEAVVTHQWENDLNYLYYDVLYGGYPLIHNSPSLRNFGYHYTSFDAGAGAEALLYAKAMHDKNLKSYKEDVGVLLASVRPEGSIDLHEALLDATVSTFIGEPDDHADPDPKPRVRKGRAAKDRR